MNNCLFTISHPKHYHWLRVCMKSVAKFASGWDSWRIVLPAPHTVELDGLIRDYHDLNPKVPMEIKWFEEWPGKGKLHHMALILEADRLCEEVGAFHNWDSDAIMTEPLDVSELYCDGKPLWGYAPFSETIRALPPVRRWKDNAERALGWEVEYDFMRWFPIILRKEVLEMTRRCITDNTGVAWPNYIRYQRELFPEGFAEYNTVGPVAWRYFHDLYSWNRTPVEAEEDGLHTPENPEGWPPFLRKITKFWTWKKVGDSGELPRLQELGLA